MTDRSMLKDRVKQWQIILFQQMVMLFYDFDTSILSSSSDLKFEEFSKCMSFDTYSVRFNTETSVNTHVNYVCM